MLLPQVSDADWKPLTRWLDTSGLALYFLDRVMELDLCHELPRAVLAKLRQNLADNTERTEAMISEASEIHVGFQRAGLSYALLKGFSLWPVSVPKLELRSQLDLDFLVAARDAAAARAVLERRGYRLQAVSGRSWEFKANQAVEMSLNDIYKPLPRRTAELHLDPANAGRDSVLERVQWRYFRGDSMPVLAPADLFLGQGLHLFKHVCSAFMRTAHMIEFRRSILARHHDDAFWLQVRHLAERQPAAPVALGVVTLLISNAMGSFAPEALTSWSVDRLPASVRLWVSRYGPEAIFGDFPGTKLYLLLQREMNGLGPQQQTMRRALLPLRLPKAICQREPNENLRTRIKRHRKQFQFVGFRLRFHLVEGFRYVCEASRWRRHMHRTDPQLTAASGMEEKPCGS